jgi:hypothetical protein
MNYETPQKTRDKYETEKIYGLGAGSRGVLSKKNKNFSHKSSQLKITESINLINTAI